MDFNVFELIIVVLFVFSLMLLMRLRHLRAEQTKLLIASEERFSTVYENSLPLLIVNNEGIIISANNHAQTLFGYGQSQLTGRKVETLMPERFRQNHAWLRNEYMKHPITRPMAKEKNLYILTSAGKELPVEISLSPTTLKNAFCEYGVGVFKSCAFDTCVLDACVLCTIYDLSSQKQSEEMLRKSETRYRNLYELMNEGYCVLDIIFDETGKPVDFKYVEVNSAFEKLTGLKNVKGKTALELMPTLEKKWFELFSEVLLTGEPINLERYVSALSRWFKVYAFRLESDENKHVAIIFNDTTQQKNHEKRLFEHGRNAQLLYKTIRVVSETHGTKQAMQNGLETICDILNFPIGHICFLDVDKDAISISSHIWHLRNPEKFREFKAASETMQFSKEGLCEHICKTEKPVWISDVLNDSSFTGAIHLRGTDIHGALGFPLFFYDKVVAIFEFFSYEVQEYNKELLFTLEVMSKQLSRIIENNKSHQELEQYAEKLKSLNQKLEDFSYIASHDLKEPLRSIGNFSKFLLEDYSDKLDDEGKAKLNILIDLSQRMHKLIDHLLKYSKIGRSDFSMKYHDIGKILDEKLELMRDFILEKNADIKILKKLPTILCDETYIGEVFQNLISNSIKYNDHDLKKIEISYEEDHHYTIFSVKDNGIGIPKESYDIIFKIFKRLHTKEKCGGEGVGMAIAKQIVEKHNGKIWLDSTVGVGTTVYFSISKKLDNKLL